MLQQPFSPETFNIVLSFNVIYHGHRERFAQAIEHAAYLLKPGGLFFFTCPSREDGKYGFGECLAPHTYRSTKSVTPGDVHYFSGLDDLEALLAAFRMVSLERDEGYWDNQGVSQFYSNWHVLAEKPSS